MPLRFRLRLYYKLTTDNENSLVKILKAIHTSELSDAEKDDAILSVLRLTKRNNEHEVTRVHKSPSAFYNDVKQVDNANTDANIHKESTMNKSLLGISVGRVPRKDGRYQGYIIMLDGRRFYFYSPYLRELKEKMRDAIASRMPEQVNPAFAEVAPKTNIDNEPQRESKATTLKEYFDRWVEVYKEPNLKPKSLLMLRKSVKFALTKLGKLPIDAITSDDLQVTLLGISGGRARDMCRINLSQCFKKALAQGVICRNPFDAVEIKKHEETHRQALTVDEQARFLEVTRGMKYSLLFKFLLASGARIGEALALHRDDIDFVKHTVTINKNVVFLDHGKRIEQTSPKSKAGNRTIPLPADLCEEIDKASVGGEIFPYTYNAVRISITNIAKKNNIPVTLHVLRHTYATRLEEAGISPKVKQYLLGHSSERITQNIYTDIQEKYIEVLSDKIRDIWSR